MEIDYTKRRAGSHRAPDLPAQRVDSSMSMPIPIQSDPEGTPGRRRRVPEQKKTKKSIRWSLLLIPVGIVMIVSGVLGALFLLPGSIDKARPGDCASFDRSHAQNPYSTVRCGSAAASFTVLQVIDGDGTCRDVAGATRSTISTESNVRREVCMGPKDVDPGTAINVAQVGDCLTGTTGQERRVPCNDPTAKVKILERINNLSNTQVNAACDEVAGASSVYSWTWDSDDGTGPAQASYQTDAVFCLGPNR